MRLVTRSEVEARLEDFDPQDAAGAVGRASAVALTLLAREGVAGSIVLTKRSTSLAAHPGQWALPGGRLDTGETSEQAALRELEEELGIAAGTGDVLGRLDDFLTQSGYRITPVVVWSENDPAAIRANPAEVAGVHLVTLDELDVDVELLDVAELPSPVLRLPFRGRFIHAPTGAFLHQFREVVLHGRSTRVRDFSSPRDIDRPPPGDLSHRPDEGPAHRT